MPSVRTVADRLPRTVTVYLRAWVNDYCWLGRPDLSDFVDFLTADAEMSQSFRGL